MGNSYYKELKAFETAICEYSNEIFKVYGGELELRLEDYNLLDNQRNCLESSTAFGYIIEEFLVSKLEIYTQCKAHKGYKILRTDGSTTTSSYDCFSIIKDNIKALINIKAEKGNNDAIAAINRLHTDYVVASPDQIKCYMILKVLYSIGLSVRDGKRKVHIVGLDSFFLEEIDFSGGHRQDHRNWSADAFNPNSGRLQASAAFRRGHKIDDDEVSFDNTRSVIKNMHANNK